MRKAKKQQKVFRMKSHQGSLRQKTPGGPYYYRVTISKGGPRKEFPLKTNDFEEAKKRAAELAVVLEAKTKDVALAQIQALKGFSLQAVNLPFSEAWEKYEKHPKRAMPHTVNEQLAYRATYEEFVRFVSSSSPLPEGSRKHTVITSVSEVCPEICEKYSVYLKTTHLAVDTHNRKIKRLRKIFDCLKDYYPSDENPRARRFFP